MDAGRVPIRPRGPLSGPARRGNSQPGRVAAATAVLAAALLSLGGCTSVAQPYAFGGAQYSAEPPIFLDGRPRLVNQDQVDRYACSNGMALECRCMGRLAASCECQCPMLVR